MFGRIVAVAFAVLLVIAIVPPFRNAAALGASKVILFVASPLAPDIDDFDDLPTTTKVLASDGSTLAELDKAQRRVPVKIDDLPDHVTRAVLAAEDQDFYEHSGIDPSAVFRAFVRTAQGQTQGGSTITQQLAKINYTARERTLLRKLKELLFATQLEKKYSKDTLLQRYLNQVYFGEGAYGIEAAAQTFFAVSAKDLTPAQAALLAGKIRAPEVIDPRKREKESLDRRNQVLDNMKQEGWLEDDEHEQARDEDIALAPKRTNAEETKAPHFVEFVKREAATIDALGGSAESRTNQLFTGGYTIETTLDPKIFDATVTAVTAQLGLPEDPVTAVATVQPGDGAIRSLFGGLDFAKTQFDMSSLAGRQAGSAFKPFVYLTALKEGIDPRTTFDGTSGRVIPCYRKDPVRNYDGEDAGGRITVDEAMVKSVNVVFAELGCQVGTKDVLDTSHDIGIPEDADTGRGAVFLGGLNGKGVNALEMASAYATFAAKGVYAEPYAIARIKNAAGKVVYERKPDTSDVFKPEEVGVLNNPLLGVVDRGTGVGAKIGRPVAGKTGTTQSNVDAWFIGYTPQLATGVWVGFPDKNQPMSRVHGRSVTGGRFPATIFADVMRAAHEGLPVEPIFTASPDSLDLKKVAPSTSVTSSSSTSSSSTSSSVPDTTTTSAPGATTTTLPGRTTTTTAAPATTTTTRPRGNTTTTSAPASTTTTVQSSSATTTTAPSP
ncbi:MAG TPA: transglycosylase domain-containing protein [Acidimicrobiales bacterium]